MRYPVGAADTTEPLHRLWNRSFDWNTQYPPQVTRIGVRVDVQESCGPEIIETEVPGNYRVESKDKLADLFAINLFDPRESSIAVVKEIELGYQAVTSDESSVEKRQEFWRWALIAMLGLIAAEWYVYSRRVA